MGAGLRHGADRGLGVAQTLLSLPPAPRAPKLGGDDNERNETMKRAHKMAIDEAVLAYIEILQDHNTRDYWHFNQVDLAKIAIANAILEQRGIALQPERVPLVIRLLNSNLPRLAKRAGRPRFIYLLFNKRNRFTKIGIATNPKAREGTLQAQEPEIDLVGFWPGTKAQEDELHAHFDAKRVRGEWFDLTVSDRDLIVRHLSEQSSAVA